MSLEASLEPPVHQLLFRIPRTFTPGTGFPSREKTVPVSPWAGPRTMRTGSRAAPSTSDTWADSSAKPFAAARTAKVPAAASSKTARPASSVVFEAAGAGGSPGSSMRPIQSLTPETQTGERWSATAAPATGRSPESRTWTSRRRAPPRTRSPAS